MVLEPQPFWIQHHSPSQRGRDLTNPIELIQQTTIRGVGSSYSDLGLDRLNTRNLSNSG